MATYKVPQDVEAEDKLIGPFSFRQFIYLIVVAICAGLAWGLYTVFPGLVIIPIPIALFFLVLALPLKKDQPFEVYLAALVHYALKPKMRMWEPEGMVKLVEINSEKPSDTIQLKEYSGEEASQKMAYLADIVDSGGWSARRAGAGQTVVSSSPLNDGVLAEIDTTDDVMDDNGTLGQSIDSLLDNVAKERRSQMEAMVRQGSANNQIVDTAQGTPRQTFDLGLPAPVLPKQVDASIKHPIEVDEAHQQHLKMVAEEELTARQQEISADILRLANNNDLSVSAISREANRLHNLDIGEVVVELR
ncbi:PrgI family protein [Candidatus Saccharibacteria bacterium]|nr:PrgI family protein [Candidatus Saccharibacteria bacterium]NCU40573.1 PrgI family protein [Candidatus Saccharibacteria bacterium]